MSFTIKSATTSVTSVCLPQECQHRLIMAPSKASLEVERCKSDVPFEGYAEVPGGVLGGLTTALAHLTLHPDSTSKDLVKLEDNLSQITLADIQTQV